jgi:hypothetical protein
MSKPFLFYEKRQHREEKENTNIEEQATNNTN